MAGLYSRICIYSVDLGWGTRICTASGLWVSLRVGAPPHSAMVRGLCRSDGNLSGTPSAEILLLSPVAFVSLSSAHPHPPCRLQAPQQCPPHPCGLAWLSPQAFSNPPVGTDRSPGPPEGCAHRKERDRTPDCEKRRKDKPGFFLGARGGRHEI